MNKRLLLLKRDRLRSKKKRKPLALMKTLNPTNKKRIIIPHLRSKVKMRVKRLPLRKKMNTRSSRRLSRSLIISLAKSMILIMASQSYPMSK